MQENEKCPMKRNEANGNRVSGICRSSVYLQTFSNEWIGKRINDNIEFFQLVTLFVAPFLNRFDHSVLKLFSEKTNNQR